MVLPRNFRPRKCEVCVPSDGVSEQDSWKWKEGWKHTIFGGRLPISLRDLGGTVMVNPAGQDVDCTFVRPLCGTLDGEHDVGVQRGKRVDLTLGV